eukprot:TRINITY_DN27984_c0_g1_i1.p1 TRINITY_DN27984_c0_g1~~TRINITY_DN27984_c0_g1_i1.p1  ORF type:complete len:196 (-),score=46.54 TRINITY_DN27984_c0_g1_i1:157-687(-)
MCIRDSMGRLQQILMNLIGNAFKFTRKGFVRVHVGRIKEKGLIRFTVEDTGTGIRAENVNKLFTAFGALNEHRGVNERGIGLGLVISQRLAQRLGPSSIVVESIAGQGSTFSFEIYEILTKMTMGSLSSNCNSNYDHNNNESPISLETDVEETQTKVVNESILPSTASKGFHHQQL